MRGKQPMQPVDDEAFRRAVQGGDDIAHCSFVLNGDGTTERASDQPACGFGRLNSRPSASLEVYFGTAHGTNLPEDPLSFGFITFTCYAGRANIEVAQVNPRHTNQGASRANLPLYFVAASI